MASVYPKRQTNGNKESSSKVYNSQYYLCQHQFNCRLILGIAIALLLLVVFTNGKILRNGEEFAVRFVVIDSDARIVSKYVFRNFTGLSEKQCSYECVKEITCQGINRHRIEGICELVNISKYDSRNVLRKDLNWVHFESDHSARNYGSFCESASPCEDYQVCEDTLEINPPFICKCRDNFTGEKCQNYTGPGMKQNQPAASCKLLQSKYQDLHDGHYWFQDEGKTKYCERKVDGRFAPWSNFGACDSKCGDGIRNRTRNCTNPQPKGGGKTCYGPKQDFQKCFQEHCPKLLQFQIQYVSTQKDIAVLTNCVTWACCSMACRNTVNCSHWTLNAGKCHLKRGIITNQLTNRTAISGTRTTKDLNATLMKWEKGACVNGKLKIAQMNHIRLGKPKTIGECQRKCRNEDGTMGCQYTSHNAECIAMKRKITNGDGIPGSRCMIFSKVAGCAETHLISTPTDIHKGHHLATAYRLEKSFYMHIVFKIEVQNAAKSWENIFHASNKGNHDGPGSRQPAIFVKPQKDKHLSVTTKSTSKSYSIGGQKPDKFFKDWVKLEVEQTHIRGTYYHTIKVNDVVELNVTNDDPTEFNYMRLYASDTWYDKAKGQIKFLALRGYCGITKPPAGE